MNVKINSTDTASKLKTALPYPGIRNGIPLRLPGKAVWVALSILIVLVAAGFSYYRFVYQVNQSSTEPAMQTATVKQGDLVLYASGTGTLISKDQVDLAFETGGQVTKINVETGDEVKAGDVLAQVDDTDAQVSYTETKRALTDLTDTSAIATAQQNMATSALDLQDAISQLEYLISPTVYYWEQEVAKDEQAVKDAQAIVNASPSDEEAQTNLKKAQAVLKYAQDSLVGAQASYEKYYVPKNFTVKEFNRTTHEMDKYVSAPSEYDILNTRAAVTTAQASLEEARNLYAALTGGTVPDDATGSSLTDLANAQTALKSAQHTLDGTKIAAPFSGTVMAVNVSVGDTVSSSTTIITLADLSQPYLEIYLDASDWSNIKTNDPVQITFDMLPDQTYIGTVVSVDPGLYTESNSSVVRAYVKIDNTDGSFNVPLGASAGADVISGQAKNAVLIPIAALHKTGDTYMVFVVENNEPVAREVEIGIQDANYAEVISGLNAGDIVTTGVTQTSSK